MLLTLFLAAAAMAADRPNVLFLFADDQRADTIGSLGNPVIKTPHIDRIVRSGVSFERAYMQGGLQGATCVPSRAMLMSGRGLFRADERLMRDPTWPAAFAKAGYSTFATGKWHNGAPSLARSFQQARSMLMGGMANPLKARLSDLDGGTVGPARLSPRHACEVFADEAIRFIDCQKDSPFVCYVAFDAPHDPHIVPEGFPVSYDPRSLPPLPNFLPQHPFDNGEMAIRDEMLLGWPRTPQAVAGMNAEYYRYVSYLDSQVGRILDALAKSPHAANTIVVYAADSGVARGAHGLIGKQNLYEESLRVPLIMSGPGIARDKRAAAMCYLFDVMPTLGALCGVKGPETSEGINLGPVLATGEGAGRPRLAFGYRKSQRALRDGPWKLIRYPEVDRTQLFNLETDPFEKDNLSDKPEHAGRGKDMLLALERDLKALGDTAPLVVDHPKPAGWTPPRGRRGGAAP
ncbi:MAG: sulfatase-like hydrolase/transferase [Planctomycetota bacterium]